jgi:hypothetical protein
LEKKIVDMAKIPEWTFQLQRSRLVGFVGRRKNQAQARFHAGTYSSTVLHFA